MDNTTYLIDEYVTTKAGEPYRLFPFGKIVKNGKSRVITPEYASRFKLPHFLPPIKLGSHDDTTPAGGHMQALEVRADGFERCELCKASECKEHGLWVVPIWNDKGGQAIGDGAYKYHSPEVLFDGAIEDPRTGNMISGPLVVGDALLHMPHLGEATALYSIEPIQTEELQMEENITLPKGFYDKFVAPLFNREPEVKEVVKEVEPEDYAATKQERDELKATIETQKAEADRKGRVEKFDAELKETKADPTMAELLADLPGEKAEAIMRQFKALSEQIKEPEITGELGGDGTGADSDPKAAFNAIVLQTLKDNPKLTNYNAAFEVAKQSHAELFSQAFKK